MIRFYELQKKIIGRSFQWRQNRGDDESELMIEDARCLIETANTLARCTGTLPQTLISAKGPYLMEPRMMERKLVFGHPFYYFFCFTPCSLPWKDSHESRSHNKPAFAIMASKTFNDLKERLRALKSEQSEIQELYKERASQRLEYQNKMASLNLMLQHRSFDTMLIEDVIVVTLVAENDARERFALMPPEPTKTPIQVQPGQKTKSLEEACNVYRSQIEVLEEMIEYRRALTATERDLDLLYRQAVDDILDIMEEYCDDEKLIGDMLSFAASGSAQCSPRKEKKKGVIGRILASPGRLFSPKKEVTKDSMQSELLPEPVSAEPPETPKRAFANFKQSAQFKELQAAPLLDFSDNDDNDGNGNDGDMHDLENEETEIEQQESTDAVERRKKKKKNNNLAKEDPSEAEISDKKNRKKKKKKPESDASGSFAADVLASERSLGRATFENPLNEAAEIEPTEKKKHKKKKKQEGDVRETTEAVAADASKGAEEAIAEKMKRKKKQEDGELSESVPVSDELKTEQVVVTSGPPNKLIETADEKEKEKTSKQNLSNENGNEATQLETDALHTPIHEAVPTVKKKKKTINKTIEDDDAPPLVEDGSIADRQGCLKKQKKKKVKDIEGGEVEVASDSVKTKKKKKKKKDKELGGE